LLDALIAKQAAGSSAVCHPGAKRYNSQIKRFPGSLFALPDPARQILLTLTVQLRAGTTLLLIAITLAVVVTAARKRPHIMQ
jgi:hypothetical protein